MKEAEGSLVLDTFGLFCPEPIMMLHSKMSEIPVGTELLVIASDPATKRDVPQFCRFLGHELLSVEETETTLKYVIKKC